MAQILEVVQRPADAEQREQHVLYTAAERVLSFDEKLQARIEDMIATMRYEQGIGIAAPQVDWSAQVFIIEASVNSPRYPHLKKYPELKDVPRQIFVNPYITSASTETVAYWHGCLSGKAYDRGLLRSYATISISAQDRDGQEIEASLDGLAAIIFQHEFRHLLGSIYYDHAHHFLPLDELREKIADYTVRLFEHTNDPSIPHMLEDYIVGETIEAYKKRKEKQK